VACNNQHVTILGGRWCNIIVLNVHAPNENKIYCTKDRFYEELEQVFDKFPKYHMKILLGDFKAKVGRGNIFKPTIGNESLHEISNDIGIRVVNFATSKNLTVKSIMFPHRNIHKFTWTSPDGRQNIFKPTIGNESLHAISNDNGDRVVKFDTSKNLPTS
jgi:hypothetical protein